VPRTRLGQKYPALRDWYAVFIYFLEKFAALNGRTFMVQWYKSHIERKGP
jgi:hypothetical protein